MPVYSARDVESLLLLAIALFALIAVCSLVYGLCLAASKDMPTPEKRERS